MHFSLRLESKIIMLYNTIPTDLFFNLINIEIRTQKNSRLNPVFYIRAVTYLGGGASASGGKFFLHIYLFIIVK